ncbi:unnamed protein product [Ectocarpus sp. 13 AM-2016]
MDETCDGKSWYTSIKELQLASLKFCIACRNYQTVQLKVDAQTPRRLLAAADDPPPHPKRLCRTRVPRLRARRVSWNMRTAAELRNPIFAMTDADCLEFGLDFEGSLDAVAWPLQLKTIEFETWSLFNQPIDLVKWPARVEKITLGQFFNHPIERAKFPASLQQLTFVGDFNYPIEDVTWPSSLRQLQHSLEFNQPIERIQFPASLQQLDVGHSFDQPIEDVLWPSCLKRLFLGCVFNQPVDNVRWPASLEEVTFRYCDDSRDSRVKMYSEFNQSIGSSDWPTSLRRLTVGGKFSQSLQGLGSWMPNLQVLRVLCWDLDDWGHPSYGDILLPGIEWPNGLRELTVFKGSSLDRVVIPSTLQVYRPSIA